MYEQTNTPVQYVSDKDVDVILPDVPHDHLDVERLLSSNFLDTGLDAFIVRGPHGVVITLKIKADWEVKL